MTRSADQAPAAAGAERVTASAIGAPAGLAVGASPVPTDSRLPATDQNPAAFAGTRSGAAINDGLVSPASIRWTAAASGPLPWALLLAASLGMFTAAASGTARAPFLIAMAQDLAVSVPLVANLVAITSVAWGITSILAGAGSDRWGRRPFLLGGPTLLAAALAGVAWADSFAGVAAWATLGGASSGLFTGVIFTEVSGRVGPGQQGRALGWVMSGQSLTLLVGVPLAAWLGAWIGWRGVSLAIAGLGLATAASLLATTSGGAAGQSAATRVPSLRAALSGPVLRLLTMGIAERICYGLVAVYYATFLQSTFSLSLEAVALPLAVFALGNILGTILGGQLADRLANRMAIFAAAMLSSGVAALALFGWPGSLRAAVGLGFAYVFCNAIARPSLMASLTAVPEHVRGTVMGLNVTCNSIGWLSAASLGGWMIGSHGFAGFGPLAAVFGVLGTLLALARRP